MSPKIGFKNSYIDGKSMRVDVLQLLEHLHTHFQATQVNNEHKTIPKFKCLTKIDLSFHLKIRLINLESRQ